MEPKTKLPCLIVMACVLVTVAANSAAGYRIETLAEGLEYPWSIAFVPDGRMLVTERAGRLRVIADGRLLDQPITGIPPAYVASQAGLFEVLLDPDYQSNGWIYLSLAHGTPSANTTRVVRGRLDGMRWVDEQVLFSAQPTRNTPVHYGGRMAFLADGSLAIGLGDGFNFREDAQRLDRHTGKLVRIHRDGSVPADNPFVGRDGVRPEIYSYGHRNIQGLVHDDRTGRLWLHEHGPRGGDELNLIRPGANYGWPVATFGLDYSGAKITPWTSRPDLLDPVIQWTPSIAPAGMTLYLGTHFPDWHGSLFITALAGRSVRRIELDGEQVIAQEVLFSEIGERLRDIRTGPDGALYLTTDRADGRVLRISADPAERVHDEARSRTPRSPGPAPRAR